MSIINHINRHVRAKAHSWLLSSWKIWTSSLHYQIWKALKTFKVLVNGVESCTENIYDMTILIHYYSYIHSSVMILAMFYVVHGSAASSNSGGGKYKAWYFNWQEYLSNYHFSVCSSCWDYVIIFLKHCGTILLFCVSFLRCFCTWHSASHLIIC